MVFQDELVEVVLVHLMNSPCMVALVAADRDEQAVVGLTLLLKIFLVRINQCFSQSTSLTHRQS